jgi:hypothetical protein
MLWLLAIGLLVSMCVPPLFHALGLSRYRIDQDELAPPPPEDEYAAGLVRQLEALGFKPLGTLTEVVHFFMFHWSWSCRQEVYGSKDQRAYAVLYRFVADEPARLAFATCFQDGAMAWTGNHSEEIRMLADDYVRWGTATTDLAELLRLHHEAAERLGSARQPVAHDQLDAFPPVMEIHARRFLRDGRMGPTMLLTTTVALAGLGPWLVGRWQGFASQWVPILFILEGLLYWWFHKSVLMALIVRDRQREARAGE